MARNNLLTKLSQLAALPPGHPYLLLNGGMLKKVMYGGLLGSSIRQLEAPDAGWASKAAASSPLLGRWSAAQDTLVSSRGQSTAWASQMRAAARGVQKLLVRLTGLVAAVCRTPPLGAGMRRKATL
jgi:hypothetical protein